jgi:MoaA/NifB/PqqE/SkfB family radical SAM enzyme
MRRILTPEGLFVYDRRTGLCLFSPDVRSKCWERPLYAQVALTDRCNLSCRFCYSQPSHGKSSEWEIGDLKRLVDFLDSWGLLGVSFGGGEPFLYPHLTEIARYTWEKTGLDVTVTTNGLAASETRIAEVEGFISEVRVSIRDMKSLTCIKKFVGKGFSIGVNLLLFRGGAGKLNGLVEEALKLGVNDFLINSFRAVGRGKTYANMEPGAEDFAELAEVIRKHSREATFKVSSRVAEALKSHVKDLVPFESEARGRIIAVTADWKVKPSSLSDEAYVFHRPEDILKAYHSMVQDPVKGDV